MRQGTSYYKFIWLQGNDAKGFRPGVNPKELHKFIKIEKQVLSPYVLLNECQLILERKT